MRNFDNDLPKPKNGAVFYETRNVYACLANYPITYGHCVVVWKKKLSDIHELKRSEYVELMDSVERVRDGLLKVIKTDKVYLLYMDEIKHVHWHLIPRSGSECGITVLEHCPGELKDTDLARKLENEI